MVEIKRSFAIVIGINKYINGIRALKTAVNDATQLAHIVKTKYQYQVLLLLDTAATYAKLCHLFTTLENQTLPSSEGSTIQLHPDDRIFFYFAGHGIALDALDNSDGPVGYLVPQDALADNNSSLLPMTRLHDALLKLPCRHLLVILDCCFAGAFRWAGQREAVRSSKMYRERYERFISGCAQQVITSAADDELAADTLYRLGQRSEHQRNSPFAELLLAGLVGAADLSKDGVITATELYVYLHTELGKLTAKQTPGFCQLKRHDKGEYIFAVPEFDPNNLETAPALDESTNPYRGLESFEEEHSKLFFGRKTLIEKLDSFVTDRQLTVVLGASGSGKSSLVKAGLIPRLKNSSQQWRILAPIRPGEFPFIALNNTLIKENLPVFALPLEAFERELRTLHQSVKAWSKANKSAKLLLVIDQFEELFTLTQSDRERDKFLLGLARAISAFPEQLRIVVTLRSDFEPQLRNTALEPYWSRARFIISGMTREELRQAITEPATARVMYFEPLSLVDNLIDEVAQMPGALPLLSFTLSELYLKYIKSAKQGERNNRAIAQADYEQLGGVTRSLTQRADCEYDELVLLDSAYAQTIKHLMLRMVAVGGGELARRRVFLTELEYPEPKNQRVQKVIEHFSQTRLLVSGQDTDGNLYIEPAHDALVRGWQKLLNWKQLEQESLILQRRLTPAAFEWSSLQQPRFLWNADPRLDLLNQVLNSSDNWFNRIEAEFVQYSVRQKRKNTFLRWSLVTGAFVVLSSATMMAINNARDARNESVEKSTALSETLFASNQELSALVEAIKGGETLNKNKFFISEDTKIRFITTLQHLIYQVRQRNGLEAHTDSVTSVSFSPDSNTIASASKDNTIKLWQRDGNLLQTLPKRQDGIFSVSFCRRNSQILISASDDNIIIWQRQHNGLFKFFKYIPYKDGIETASLSPDCKTIATASKKYTVKLWDWDGKLIKTFLPKHEDQIKGLDFSPDGETITSASWDRNLKLWSIKDGKLLQTIKDDSAFYNVRFVDSKTIASASTDGKIKLWNLQGKLLKSPFKGHIDRVLSLDVSRDGKTIASTSADHTVKLWNLKDGTLLKSIVYPGGIVNQVSFSPDSKMIALANEDKTVKFWSIDGIGLSTKDLEGSRLSFSLDSRSLVSGDRDGNVRLWQRDENIPGGWKFVRDWKAHDNEILKISFSPVQTIATASSDGTVKLWRIDGTLIKLLQGHTKSVLDISFSPDGNTIASASADKTVKLWGIDGKLLKNFVGHTKTVTSVSFSPDGNTIASASADETIRLWYLDGRLPKIFQGHQKGVLSVNFSPNGEMIASSGNDNTIRLWNVNGQQIKSFPGHKGIVYRVKFSQSGQILASASKDKTIRLWSVNGKLSQILQELDRPVADISFSYDDRTIASADFSQKLIIWNLDLDNLLRQGCSWLHDYLQSNHDLSQSNLCKQK